MASSSISSVLASTATSSTQTTTASISSTDEDDFMTILLAELKYQDPTSPMDSTQMMSQLATLNQLNAILAIKDTLNEMKTSQTISYAASLIGKTITAIPDANDSSTYVKGVVSSIIIEGGVTTVQVDGQDIELSTIVAVAEG